MNIENTSEIFTIFFTHVLLPLLSFFIIRCVISSRKKLPLPPGPFPWPIIGHLFHLGNKPHVSLAKMAHVHGPDLMSIRLGGRLVIVASSPVATAEVLKTHDRLLSGRFVPHPMRVEGSYIRNLATETIEECDENWKKVRSMYQIVLFSHRAVGSQVNIREKKVMELVNFVASKEGQLVNIKDIAFITILNILSNSTISIDLVDFEGKGIGEGMRQWIRNYTKLEGVPQLADLYPILDGCTWDFQGTYKKLKDTFERVSDVWRDIINKKRKEISGKYYEGEDFADALIRNGFEDKQINALLMELYSAGTETTITTVEWTLVELLKNPKAMKRLRNEITKVVTIDEGEIMIVKESDLPNLPYLDACMKETLRLHPPAPLLFPHRAVQTCEVMGYRIPRDTQIIVNVWKMARDPEYWNDPSSFKPDRFLDSSIDYKGQDFEFIPFGSGRRICAGQSVALRMLPMIIGSLVHKFELVLPNNMDPIEMNTDDIIDVTVAKKDPLFVIPKMRKS
ncbi:hypothetical protein RND71_020700 [Anisodus tanguticus]|uniref:Cytochrome P450 n=1 Tax=Anisodus tanguticus TaxID=243964 RepID=A0AAE1RV56_9SOLA|nr:hypothetical protein RND71_020700 [Anisodus tanguticus]